MKKLLTISVIAGTCLVLMTCKKNDNNNSANNHTHFSYTLNLDFKYDTWPAGRFDWKLTDKASFDIDVKDSVFTFSNFQNEDGLVSPTVQYFSNNIESCTSTWQQGESVPGYINITTCTGRNFGGMGEEVVRMTLDITSSNAKTPKFTEVWTKSGTFITGGDDLTPEKYFYTFILNNETQTQTVSLLTATLIPN